jgi:hypothetical protein
MRRAGWRLLRRIIIQCPKAHKPGLREFQQYVTPDDGRKFAELYNVQCMTSIVLDPVSKVCITTIQRLYSMLSGEPGFDPQEEKRSLWGREHDLAREAPKLVRHNPALPIDYFDFIITDECHRSIHNLWRQVLEYFDAHLIGLTATPWKQTLGFFNQNLVMEYSCERAVGVVENPRFDMQTMERRRTVPFDKLLERVAWGVRDDDTLTTLAGRLARLERAARQRRKMLASRHRRGSGVDAGAAWRDRGEPGQLRPSCNAPASCRAPRAPTVPCTSQVRSTFGTTPSGFPLIHTLRSAFQDNGQGHAVKLHFLNDARSRGTPYGARQERTRHFTRMLLHILRGGITHSHRDVKEDDKGWIQVVAPGAIIGGRSLDNSAHHADGVSFHAARDIPRLLDPDSVS